MSEWLWQLERVTLAGGVTPRLDEVTLSIGRGVTAVLGYSGAGKTSLLNVLVGFEEPTRGVVRTNNAPRGGGLSLFWSPQDGGLWPHLTVREHLHRVAGRPMDELLARFDLEHRADAKPAELSQGERSRLSVARTLASGAAVMVMDEPLSHVDPQRVGGYFDAILESVASSGSSLVFATHSPRQVLAHAAEAVVMRDGKVLYAGPVQPLYHNPATEDLARSLGDCNWFAGDEARQWLSGNVNGRACYRPEQVVIERDESSPIVVESSRFEGDVARVEVRHALRDERRAVFHRPASAGLRAGDRVVLRVLTLMLAAVLLWGCADGSEPELRVSAMHTWSMPPDGATIPAPRSITIMPDRRTLVLDTAGRILIFSTEGKCERQWNMPTNEAGNPEDACLLRDGRIAVADTHYHRVVFFDQEGKVLSMLGSEGRGPGEFIYPVSIVQDEKDRIYVCEYGGNDRVQRFSVNGEHELSFGGNGQGPGLFQRASGMVYLDGKLYIADASNNRIQVYTRDGQFTGVLGETPLEYPYDLCLAADRTLYVIEYGAGRVTRLGLDGKLLGRVGSTGTAIGQFRTPWGIGIEASKRLIVADTGNRRIVEIKL